MQSPEHLHMAATQLVNAIQTVADSRRAELERMKADRHKFEQPDWLWEALLLSLSTMGNSRGAALVKNPEFHARVRFSTIQKTERKDRQLVIEGTMRKAKVRMPLRKAQFLCQNFDRIVAT